MANEGYLPLEENFATLAIHTGQEPENWDSCCLMPPLVLSSSFKIDYPGVIEVCNLILLTAIKTQTF